MRSWMEKIVQFSSSISTSTSIARTSTTTIVVVVVIVVNMASIKIIAANNHDYTKMIMVIIKIIHDLFHFVSPHFILRWLDTDRDEMSWRGKQRSRERRGEETKEKKGKIWKNIFLFSKRVADFNPLALSVSQSASLGLWVCVSISMCVCVCAGKYNCQQIIGASYSICDKH